MGEFILDNDEIEKALVEGGLSEEDAKIAVEKVDNTINAFSDLIVTISISDCTSNKIDIDDEKYQIYSHAIYLINVLGEKIRERLPSYILRKLDEELFNIKQEDKKKEPDAEEEDDSNLDMYG